VGEQPSGIFSTLEVLTWIFKNSLSELL